VLVNKGARMFELGINTPPGRARPAGTLALGAAGVVGVMLGALELVGCRRNARARLGLIAATVVLGLWSPGLVGSASGAACSTSTGGGSCTINASLTVTAGTLTLESSPNLYWAIVQTGYDQWASASATSLSSCSASGTVTTCSGGTKPTLLVLDGTGSASGW